MIDDHKWISNICSICSIKKTVFKNSSYNIYYYEDDDKLKILNPPYWHLSFISCAEMKNRLMKEIME